LCDFRWFVIINGVGKSKDYCAIIYLTPYSVFHKSIAPSTELCSKMALSRRSRRVTPMMMPSPCPSSRLLRTLFKSYNFFIMENDQFQKYFRLKLKNVRFHKAKLLKFKTFNFDLKYF